MDVLLLENKASYLAQIANFEESLIPLPNKGAKPAEKETLSDSDTIIGVRIRPLSEQDKEFGHVPSVRPREKGGYADVHQLRVKVRGPPVLTVRMRNQDGRDGMILLVCATDCALDV